MEDKKSDGLGSLPIKAFSGEEIKALPVLENEGNNRDEIFEKQIESDAKELKQALDNFKKKYDTVYRIEYSGICISKEDGTNDKERSRYYLTIYDSNMEEDYPIFL